ncbi:helix-turn-helix domain-containing protein [bacterium]|nr:helix-turn-helix domain-containing protein [bacterium]
MLRTYKYRIYPTKEQSENINTQMFSCARLYNKMLKQRIDLYKKK